MQGSDHCPVYGEFKDVVSIEGDDGRSEVSLIDMMNPPGVFNNGVRQKEWNIKELPSFSARLMPEFYQRRSIKDMFKKPTAPAAPTTTASSSSGQTGSASTSKAIQSTNANSALDETAGASSTNVVISPSPERKRKASETSTTQSSKKQKPTPSSTSKTAPAKGQKSLKGFFQAKPKPEEQSNGSNENVPAARETTVSKDTQETIGDTTASEAAYASSTPPSLSTKDLTSSANARGIPVASDTPAKSVSQPLPPPDDADEMVYDPIVNKESWQTLFRKPAAPLCESHEEPCKSMQTKKKGENQGRSFWMCARPLGPSGNKEKGTQWRCPTFIWCSDFKGGETK